MIARTVARLFGQAAPASPASSEPIAFAGDFARWEDAARASTGYGAPVILERTRDALLKVKHGEAAYERDSVLFDKPDYAFPLLAALLRAGRLDGGAIRVADFGGSLGSTYFQCRRFLTPCDRVEWSVIEQPSYVRCGREHFEDDDLRFYGSIDECRASRQPSVLLLSSVLQYLPEPYTMLETLLGHRLRHIIVDRTAFLAADRDRLTVQTVPEWIYPASYPAWFLSESKFLAAMARGGYSLVTDFRGADDISPIDEPAYFKGYIYDRVPQ